MEATQDSTRKIDLVPCCSFDPVTPRPRHFNSKLIDGFGTRSCICNFSITGYEIRSHPSSSSWVTWASGLIFFSFRFLICKLRMTTVPESGCWRTNEFTEAACLGQGPGRGGRRRACQPLLFSCCGARSSCSLSPGETRRRACKAALSPFRDAGNNGIWKQPWETAGAPSLLLASSGKLVARRWASGT